jgi:hypothetical protein
MATTPRSVLSTILVGFVLEAGVSTGLLVAGPEIAANLPGLYYALLVLAGLGIVIIALGLHRWRRFEQHPPVHGAPRPPWPVIVLATNTVATISGWFAGRQRRRPSVVERPPSAWEVVHLVSAGGTGIALELEAGEVERRPAWWRPWRALLLLFAGALAVTVLAAIERIPGPGGPSAVAVTVVGALLVLLFGTVFDDLRRLLRPFQDGLGRALGLGALVWSLAVAVVSGVQLGNAAPTLLIDFATDWSKLFHDIAPIAVEMSLVIGSYLLLVAALALVLARYPFEEEEDPELRIIPAGTYAPLTPAAGARARGSRRP